MITPLSKPSSPFLAICVTFTTVCNFATCFLMQKDPVHQGILLLLELVLVGTTISTWIRYLKAYVAEEIDKRVEELRRVQAHQSDYPSHVSR
jgi:hypothetical protein